MRFNPPPNWPPTPPGWTPPPGWQPDPSWPPPPPGWQLWVPDAGPKRGKGLLIGGIVAAVAVVAIVVAVVFFTTGESRKPSDEEQIRAVVTTLDDAWNSSDLDKLKTLVCASYLQENELNKDEFQEAREENGRLTSTVHSVEVTGDTATASIEEKYENEDESDTNEIEFVRENGDWKYCPN